MISPEVPKEEKPKEENMLEKLRAPIEAIIAFTNYRRALQRKMF